eukprot:11212575-Lingulodinium_polyedra.AAC.1
MKTGGRHPPWLQELLSLLDDPPKDALDDEEGEGDPAAEEIAHPVEQRWLHYKESQNLPRGRPLLRFMSCTSTCSSTCTLDYSSQDIDENVQQEAPQEASHMCWFDETTGTGKMLKDGTVYEHTKMGMSSNAFLVFDFIDGTHWESSTAALGWLEDEPVQPVRKKPATEKAVKPNKEAK